MLGSLQYLAIALMTLSGPSCQGSVNQEGPPAPEAPLTVDEKRLILRHLVSIESMRAELALYRDHVRRERELAEKERANGEKALELAAQEAGLVRRELELERRRADFYEAAYKALGKGRSRRCWFLKIVSAWMIPCH